MATLRRASLALGAILAAVALFQAVLVWFPVPVPNVRMLIRVVSALHQLVYRLSDGLLGGTFASTPVLLLTTTGARSGQRRTTPLLYLADDDNFIVAASNAGNDRDPGWWRNLLRHPEAEIQVRRVKLQVSAAPATPEERRHLWPRLIELYPDYATYQRRTSREIPVAILRPQTQGSGAEAVPLAGTSA